MTALRPYSLDGQPADACASKTKLLWRSTRSGGVAFEWCGDTGHGVRMFRGSGPPLAIFHLDPFDYDNVSLSEATDIFRADCVAWLATHDRVS